MDTVAMQRACAYGLVSSLTITSASHIVPDVTTTSSIPALNIASELNDSTNGFLGSTTGMAVIGSVGGIVLIVMLVAIYVRYIRHDSSVSTKERTDRANTLSDALGKGYKIAHTPQNPLRSKEFKPIMEMLKANGEFADENESKEVFYVVLKKIRNIVGEQILEVEKGDIIAKRDQEGEWIWGTIFGREGWIDGNNVRELTDKEVAAYKKNPPPKRQSKDHKKRDSAKARAKASADIKKVAEVARQVGQDVGCVNAAEALSWDPGDMDDSNQNTRGMTTRPDNSDAVSAAITTASANRRKSLAVQNRKESTQDDSYVSHLAPEISPEELDLLNDADLSPADEEGEYQGKVRPTESAKMPRQSVTELVSPMSPIDPDVAKQFYDMFE